MATGRTSPRYVQYYCNGTDLTGETRSVGPIAWDADYTEDAALNWEAKGGLCGMQFVTLGQVNTIMRFDTTATASPLDIIHGWDQALTTVMVPVGIRAAAAAGDPCAMLSLWQKKNEFSHGEGLATVTIDYESAAQDSTATKLAFDTPWGTLVHAKGSETGANSSSGIDNAAGAATSLGAWMMVQIFGVTGAGTVTITLQDSADNQNATFANVTSLTTGAVANTSAPMAIWAQTTATATIKRYVRWQVSLAGSTAVNFALSYARGR